MKYILGHRKKEDPPKGFTKDRRVFDTPFAAIEAATTLAMRRFGQGYTIIVVAEGATEPALTIET